MRGSVGLAGGDQLQCKNTGCDTVSSRGGIRSQVGSVMQSVEPIAGKIIERERV